MLLEGSCYCGAVSFSLQSAVPYPFMRCYCSICRKTAGGGGYAINLGGDAATLKVTGKRNITVFHAAIDGEESPGERRFCKKCGSALWVWDPRWPDLIHPFASAIDTDLPVPPERVHLMLAYAPGWCEPDIRKNDQRYEEYPVESIDAWHEKRGLTHRD